MKLRMKRLAAALAAACLLIVPLAGCSFFDSAAPSPSAQVDVTETPAAPTPEPTPTPTPEPTPTPRPILALSGMLPGEKPKGFEAVLTQLNSRLAEDIFADLSLAWAPQDKYTAALTEAIAAGKSPDFFWARSADVAAYAKKGWLAPLDGPMDEYGAALYDNIDSLLFETMKIDGKLMAVPSAGNVPLCDTDRVFTIREDIRSKYDLPALDTVANMELFLKTVQEKEPGLVGLSCKNVGYVIMKAFGDEELLAGTNGSVAFLTNDGKVTCLPMQDAASFKGAVAKARQWFQAGLIPKGALGVKDTRAALSAGTAAMSDGKALLSSTLQAAVAAKAPGAELMDQPLFGAVKMIEGDGGSALCLAANSERAAEAVQFWAWVLSSQENYDLLCYGVEAVDYTLADDRITVLKTGYSTFPEWVFRNLNYMRFPTGTPDSAIEGLRHWNDNAVISPLAGFAFDPKNVKNELAKLKKVVDAYTPVLYSGASDTTALLAEYAAKLTEAGQAKVVAEAQKQADAFLASAQ